MIMNPTIIRIEKKDKEIRFKMVWLMWNNEFLWDRLNQRYNHLSGQLASHKLVNRFGWVICWDTGTMICYQNFDKRINNVWMPQHDFWTQTCSQSAYKKVCFEKLGKLPLIQYFKTTSSEHYKWQLVDKSANLERTRSRNK